MLGQQKAIAARIMGPSLVVAFHKANPPLVWKFDLERNHSFTLALQGEEGDWELGLTSPKGEFYPVVRFLSREDAEEAFAGVQKALTRKKYWALWLAVKMVVGVIALLALSTYIHAYLERPHMSLAASQTAPSTADMPEGVPVPANGFLAPPPPAPSGVPVPANSVLVPPQ